MLKRILLGIILFLPLAVLSFVGERKSFVSFVPQRSVEVHSLAQLQDLVKMASIKGHKLSIAGARKSQGGQTSDIHATMIDMTKLNRVIAFDKKGKRITVQAGITWKELLSLLNTAGLSVKTMQSYCDFTVGGSLGVNAHGQDINNCSVCESVESFQIIVADGSIAEVSATKNAELFKLALGGYGLFGIITEVTLLLTDNMLLQKKAEVIKTSDYPNYFETGVRNNKNVALHSARLTVAPNELLTQALVITYSSTGQKAPMENLVMPQASKVSQVAFGKMREHEWVRRFRLFVEKTFFEKSEEISRNKALSETIESLKNNSVGTQDILQEYFIPCAQFNNFVEFLKNHVREYAINLLNVTIRYVKPTQNSFLTYAPCEAFAFVLYINVEESESSFEKVSYWSQLLIAHATKLGGTYYLPYQLFAPRQQVKNAYPQWDAFVALKKKYDPQELFINQLYRKYVIRR